MTQKPVRFGYQCYYQMGAIKGDPKDGECDESCIYMGGYARIYLKFTILKIYMHRVLVARARAFAARAKVGGMSQL